ncbi:hypothetical protein DPMN_005817 [Dreissena polymorpha]|uniref:Uncharacterized protein n=1 Tax=Dreissena polymorpha TaxID=45954 RepID=A0A9D4MTG1_DREPO|nr:hypothetical protein DPMN_005817 [Dreissena polymorpha]
MMKDAKEELIEEQCIINKEMTARSSKKAYSILKTLSKTSQPNASVNPNCHYSILKELSLVRDGIPTSSVNKAMINTASSLNVTDLAAELLKIFGKSSKLPQD